MPWIDPEKNKAEQARQQEEIEHLKKWDAFWANLQIVATGLLAIAVAVAIAALIMS